MNLLLMCCNMTSIYHEKRLKHELDIWCMEKTKKTLKWVIVLNNRGIELLVLDLDSGRFFYHIAFCSLFI